MSALIIKLVQSSGDVRSLRTLSNAIGFAHAIWGPICEKYVGAREFSWLGSVEIAQQVWNMEHDERLPHHWKAALLMSFDRAIIEPDKFVQAAQDLSDFCRDTRLDLERVNHLPAIIWALGQKHEYPHCRGMCFRGTTAGEDLWTLFAGTAEERPYNVDKDTGHFFVYERLEQNERQATH